MNTQKVWKTFLKSIEGSTLEKLAVAVIRQLGGVDEDSIRTLQEVRNAADGWTGFIYYNDTCDFYRRNREAIMENLKEFAEDMDIGLLETVHNFNAVKGNYTMDEIGKALYGSYDREESTGLYNILAWYALEEVAFHFQDWWYEQDEECYEE